MSKSKNKKPKKQVEHYAPLQVQQVAAERHLNLKILLAQAWARRTTNGSRI